MLDSKDFDLWADDYDKSVGLSDDDGTSPFAGYKLVLGEIYRRVVSHAGGAGLHDASAAYLSVSDGKIPFGSSTVLNDASAACLSVSDCEIPHRRGTVLDLGVGTGTLTKKLYDQGFAIDGQDFSEKMLAIAREMTIMMNCIGA